MADHRDGEQPEPDDAASTPPSGADALPEMDEEQLRQFRQFQEFQRFQQFLQYQRRLEASAADPDADNAGGALTGPVGPRTPAHPETSGGGVGHGPANGNSADGGQLAPRPSVEPDRRRRKRRIPPWLSRLGGKLLTAGLVLLAMVIGGYLLIDRLFGGSDPKTPEEQAAEGGRKAEETKLFASDPYTAVRLIYGDIGTGANEEVCYRFDEDARVAFARNIAGHGDCLQAVAELTSEVDDVNDYKGSLPRSTPTELYEEVAAVSAGGTHIVDSCEATAMTGGLSGGPALGTFIVEKIPDAKRDQWLITGHEAGPRECPADDGTN